MTDDRGLPSGEVPSEPGVVRPADPQSVDMAKPATMQKRWALWIALGTLAVGVTVALMWAFSSDPEPAPEPTPTVVAQPSRTPTPTPTPSPSLTPSPTPSPSPSPEGQVAITETESMAFSPVWDPPDKGENFWQIVDPEHGYPESGGTQYVLAHACAAGDCAGDEFRRLQVGDSLTYKGELYEVQERQKVWKEEIAAQDIWYHDSKRLVLITCIIEVQGVRAVQNDLIVATRG